MNIWQQLRARKRPFLGLSPMDGVSDFPFREINAIYGKPDVVYSEFANVEGVCHSRNTHILQHFDFSNNQRPFIAQIFGKKPDYFRQVAILLCTMGVDGIDINMGCPAKTVAAHGSGAALIDNPSLAAEIIQATKQGVREWYEGATMDDCENLSPQMRRAVFEKIKKFQLTPPAIRQMIPVSVKTRLGTQSDTALNWISFLLTLGIDALTLHGRTLKQSYSGQADWQSIGEVAKLVKKQAPELVFIGNGDVKSYEQAKQLSEEYGVDGVLIGRATFGQPFVFLPELERQKALREQNIFAIALQHARIFEATYMSGDKSQMFFPMRKHLAWYTKGIEQAAMVRSKLVRAENSAMVEQVLLEHQLLNI